MSSGGPRDFSVPTFRGGLVLNSQAFHGGGGWYPGRTRNTFAEPGVALETAGRTTIVQLHWLGGDQPVNLAPIDHDFDLLVTTETDYFTFLEAQERGEPVSLWLDQRITDQWYIPGANAGQVTWRSSRWLPWSSTWGVDHATSPPEVWLEDAAGVRVAQTIITTGTPIAGEVLVPETGGDFGDLETPADLTERWLILRYAPVLVAKIGRLRVTLRELNSLRFSCPIEEILAGDYTIGVAAA